MAGEPGEDAAEMEGAAIGVTGTPTHVIDGVRLDGGRRQDVLCERIGQPADRLPDR